jgi:hypothetical protein
MMSKFKYLEELTDEQKIELQKELEKLFDVRVAQEQYCEWVLDDEIYMGETIKHYKTACGGNFPHWVKENNYKYCPFCGREIKE